jgi:hypothetical protein
MLMSRSFAGVQCVWPRVIHPHVELRFGDGAAASMPVWRSQPTPNLGMTITVDA